MPPFFVNPIYPITHPNMHKLLVSLLFSIPGSFYVATSLAILSGEESGRGTFAYLAANHIPLQLMGALYLAAGFALIFTRWRTGHVLAWLLSVFYATAFLSNVLTSSSDIVHAAVVTQLWIPAIIATSVLTGHYMESAWINRPSPQLPTL